MPGFISIVPPLLCFVFLYRIAIRTGADSCRAVLTAAPIFGVLLVAITELLSLVHLIAPAPLLCAWAMAAIIAAVALFNSQRRPVAPSPATRWRTEDRWIVVGIIFIVAFIGALGLLGAPTNWDSMTYHLSRVMHWMQNRSVAHYPTQCLAQLYQGPGAEFAILHLQLLWGSDRLAFGVQWLAMIGCIVAVVSIARRLGCGSVGQLLAVLFIVTLPAGILQGQSTQNNWVLAFWMLCWIDAIFQLRSSPSAIAPAIFAGAAMGLAVLTKGTSYLLGFPLLIWLILEAARRGWKRGIRALAIAALLTIALNIGHWTRNWKEFGSPLVPQLEAPYLRVTAMSPPLWISNMLRNLALQMATPSRRFNDFLVRAIATLDFKMNVDPNDPRITFPGRDFAVALPVHSEDLTGNPWHLVIIAGAFVVAIAGAIRTRGDGGAIYYRAAAFLVLPALGFVVFCLSLKWQPYHSRLHLPLFILAAPPVGLLLERLLPRVGVRILAAALFAAAMPYLLDNPGRPIHGEASILRLPRSQQYFANNPSLYPKYVRIADLLAEHSAQKIGFLADRNGWEYPLWILLRDRQGHWPHIHDLTDQSMSTGTTLDAVIVLNAHQDAGRLPPEIPGWPAVPIDDQIKLFLRPIPPTSTLTVESRRAGVERCMRNVSCFHSALCIHHSAFAFALRSSFRVSSK